MQSEAAGNFVRDGIQTPAAGVQWEYLADMRYQGQEHTVKVAFPLTMGVADIITAADRFHAAHEKRYTYRLANPIQIVNLHLVARVPVPKPELPKKVWSADAARGAARGKRRVDFAADGVHDATVYDGIALSPGTLLHGPAIVQEPSVTLVVGPGHRVSLDDYGNYHVHLDPS